MLALLLLVATDASPKTQDIERAFEALKRNTPALLATSADAAVAQDLLRRMVAVDQAAQADAALLRSVEEHNTTTLKAMLKEVEWFTVSRYGADADRDAWLLVQHSDRDVAFQKDVLARLERLVEKRETSRSNYAYLYDRVAVNEGREQRYGTQGKCMGKKWEPRPIEDPKHVDMRRAWAEIAAFPLLADYAAKMSEFCR